MYDHNKNLFTSAVCNLIQLLNCGHCSFIHLQSQCNGTEWINLLQPIGYVRHQQV